MADLPGGTPMNGDAVDALHEEDPLIGRGALGPSLARIEARVAASLLRDGNTERRHPGLMGIGLAIAGAGLVAALALNGVFGGTLGSGTVAPVAVASAHPSVPVDVMSCVFSPANDLGEREYVFYGTVREVTATDVDFAVDKWVRGPGGQSITLRLSPGYGGSQFMDEGSPLMKPGTRWRVAGDGGFIWGCGFTIQADGE